MNPANKPYAIIIATFIDGSQNTDRVYSAEHLKKRLEDLKTQNNKAELFIYKLSESWVRTVPWVKA